MREILFRGKRKDNDEWEEGDLIQLHDGRMFIVDNKFGACIGENGNFINTESPFVCEVIPGTIGQYTGLVDKNGKKIFEWDIIKDDWGKKYIVFYTIKSCAYMAKCESAPNEHEIGNYRLGSVWCDTIQVIGDIHDNPELLKGCGENENE